MARFLGSILLSLLLVAALNGPGPHAATTRAAQACDPSYPFVCLPPGLNVTCDILGMPVVVVYDPARGAIDPYFLDPDFDGVGCEGS